MEYPILKSMLGEDVFQQLVKYWPDKSFSAHGPLNRLPAPLTDDILSSITSLTRAYQGNSHEIDPRKGGYEMHSMSAGTAGVVIKRGSTAYLHDISPLLNNADTFTQGLEDELNIDPGSANLGAFISAAGSGASVHYDALDLISIQLVGAKKFYISPVKEIRFPYGVQYTDGSPPFDELYPQISQGFPDCKDQAFEQVNMLPGSVLFMPRGTWHYTEAEDDSMAMSIALSPPTQLDFFLYHLKSTLLQDPVWRSPCYGLGKADGVDSNLYSNLSSTISKMVENYLDPHSPIRSFHEDSRFLRNPGVDVQVTDRKEFYEVEYQGVNAKGKKGTVRIETSQEIANIFRWLIKKNGPFTVRECLKDFPGVSLDVFKELFSRLSHTGFLKKLWFVEL